MGPKNKSDLLSMSIWINKHISNEGNTFQTSINKMQMH